MPLVGFDTTLLFVKKRDKIIQDDSRAYLFSKTSYLSLTTTLSSLIKYLIKSISSTTRIPTNTLNTTHPIRKIMDNNNLQCLGDSFCSGNHFTTVTSNSTLLTAYLARLGMILFAIAHIIFTQRVIKKINTYSWFVIQLILHPAIVGGRVYLANVTRNEWWGVLALPFVFNFCAEPMDLSKLPSNANVIFHIFMYIHHAGPWTTIGMLNLFWSAGKCSVCISKCSSLCPCMESSYN